MQRLVLRRLVPDESVAASGGVREPKRVVACYRGPWMALSRTRTSSAPRFCLKFVCLALSNAHFASSQGS